MEECLHPPDTEKARELQEQLRKRIRIGVLPQLPRFIAGVDAAFVDSEVIAVASLYSFPRLEHIQNASFREKSCFPYIPGLLAFREGPAFIGAVKSLAPEPDLLMIDGHGIAHPRGIGIASHLGVMLNKPAIGCAKSVLTGRYAEPGRDKGDWTPLFDSGEHVVGAVLRTRSNVKPLFVSPGHLIDTLTCVRIVMGCVTRYRIPEPLRHADILSRKLKKERVQETEG